MRGHGHVVVAPLSPGEALRLLQASISDEHSETPTDGFLSAQQWSEAWGKSLRHTRDLLKTAIKKGLAEKKLLRQRTGDVQFFRFTG